MGKLKEIFNEINEVFNSDKDNYEKSVELYQLERLSNRETWTTDKKYALTAQELSDYANFKWAEIYTNSDKETQNKIDEYVFDQMSKGIKL